MTGSVMALAALAQQGGGGGGGGALGALSWGNIAGALVGSNAPLTISGISGGHSFSAAMSPTLGLSLGYTLNGAFNTYSGPFTVHAGDTLGWTITNAGKPTRSGTVTVTDATTSAVVDVFNFALAGNGYE